MPYSIAIEDEARDVLSKAMRGLGLSRSQVAEKSGMSEAHLEDVLEGRVEPARIAALASVLGLGGEALLALAVKEEAAPEPAFPEGLFRANTPYGDMTVNAYLVYDPGSTHAVIFDSGADATELLEQIAEKGLAVDKILLTHTHGDHVFDVERLAEKTDAPVFSPAGEPLEGAGSIEPGTVIESGNLRIEARPTTGHSAAGMSYYIQGLAQPIAIVGDALFARSMGGPNISYADCLRHVREQLLSLPDETILCPGHGPLTTVATEKRWNPFFAV